MTNISYEKLYKEYREKVLAYLKSRVAGAEEAEDICQDVFEQILKSLPRYDAERSSVSTWIYNITRFTLIDYIRTKHEGMPLPENMAVLDDIEEKIIRKETLENLAKVLKAMDREERDIIILRYYKGYTLTEIANLTGISYGMVKVKHKKALKKIGEELK
ncbi:MAG: sigma-70 family RNA polymerase sigma factor [Clostridia bacterium]|nr:sigma-70 family RNA polymerase sigma factor [Clostridia bacterium]